MKSKQQDGFLTSQSLNYLHLQGKRFLFTAGLVTSGCVLFTTASTAQQGFLARVVSDCCVDYADAHAIALKCYRGFLFDGATLDEIPQHLQQWQIQMEQLNTLLGFG